MSVPTGGNQSYQGLGFYGDGEPPKKRNGLLIAVIAAAVVLVGVTTTLLVIKPKTVATGEALAVANVTTGSSSKTTTSTTKKSGGALQPQATGAPLVPGWTPIAINDGGEIDSDKAFDVPPTWKQVTGMGNSVIVGKAGSSAKIYFPVTYMQGYCPTSQTSFRSMAGLLLLPNNGELAPQVTDVAQKIADAVYTTGETNKPKVDMGAQQPVTVNGGKKGIVQTAKATLTPGDNKCDAPSAIVTVMTFEPKPEDKTILVMAAFADQGFPEATSEEDLKKIVTSVHPAN